MTNPLLDKFYEIYPEKKEEPKPEYVKLSEEQMDIVSKYLTTPDNYSNTNTQSTITTTNLLSSCITAVNPYNIEFFKVANEIQKGNARVVSIVVNREILGKTSIKFEVVMDD